jgi:hydrogenase expression/formation protein HypC
MCIGVPMQVIATEPHRAKCAGRGEEAWLDTILIGAQPVDTWVLAFRGAAIRVLTPDEAAATNGALDALQAVLAGDTRDGARIDALFADLVGREPQLPDHLKEPAR